MSRPKILFLLDKMIVQEEMSQIESGNQDTGVIRRNQIPGGTQMRTRIIASQEDVTGLVALEDQEDLEDMVVPEGQRVPVVPADPETEVVQGDLRDVEEVAALEDWAWDPTAMEVVDIEIIDDVVPVVVQTNGIGVSK